MARSFLLQDWLHLQGESRALVYQTEPFWLDLGPFTDIVFYTSIRFASGSAELFLEGSPSKTDELFEPLGSRNTVGERFVDKITLATAPFPHTRWVRWRAHGLFAWEITFRIWVTAVATAR